MTFYGPSLQPLLVLVLRWCLCFVCLLLFQQLQLQSILRCRFLCFVPAEVFSFVHNRLSQPVFLCLSLAFIQLLQSTCFYHQVSKVFYRPVVPLSSGICHRSVPSYDSKASLFGLMCGALPIFSQVSALFNQELYSCFPWRTQSLGCPELPLADEDEECSVSKSPTVH